MKLVIFDIDGTLTDTKKVDDKCFVAAFKQTFDIELADLDWGISENVTDWGITEAIFASIYKRKPTHEEYNKMVLNFTKILRQEKLADPKQFDEITGSVAFYNHIKNNTNWQLGIATGSWEESALIKLEAIGIDANDVAFSNSDYFISREEITLYAIEQAKKTYKKEIHDIVYFGDGVWDYTTCKNLNIPFIGIDILNDKKLEDIGAKIVFENFCDTDAIMEAIKSY